jgi:hypothetical protein
LFSLHFATTKIGFGLVLWKLERAQKVILLAKPNIFEKPRLNFLVPYNIFVCYRSLEALTEQKRLDGRVQAALPGCSLDRGTGSLFQDEAAHQQEESDQRRRSSFI